jgi:hypothetical protein
MKLLRLALLVSLTAVSTMLANVPPVTPPPKRAEALAAAQALLQTGAPALPADVVNPFYSEAFAATTGAMPAPSAAAESAAAGDRPGGPRRSPSELLAAIADGLRPSGYIVMGGVPSLSFGQKRVKAGEKLTITFEGSEYTVEVAAIDRTHFTVRLGNETYTRPIK